MPSKQDDSLNKGDCVNEDFERNNSDAVLFMMRHHKLLLGAGFALVFLGLIAATAGILGLTAGILGLGVAITKGLAVAGGTAGIGLCAGGGGATLLGGILAGMGWHGRYKQAATQSPTDYSNIPVL